MRSRCALLFWVAAAGLLWGTLAGAAAAAGLPPGAKPLINDALPRPAHAVELMRTRPVPRIFRAPFGAGYYDTSEYMLGSVAVAIFLPESDGSIDGNQETWTAAELDTATAGIEAAMEFWASNAPGGVLSFQYEVHRAIPTPYEPINHGMFDEAVWNSYLANLGYTNADVWVNIYDYLNDLRDRLGTDWAFAITCALDDHDSDYSYPDWFAAAWLGGPSIAVTYHNDGWGVGYLASVAAHEAGHTFWALDEYAESGCTPSERSGYLNVENANCENGGAGLPCLMGSGTTGSGVCSYSRGQIGWRDSDADSIPDILDTNPIAVLNPHIPNPTDDETPTFMGSGNVNPLPNQNPIPWDMHNNISINTIIAAQWRVDGAQWEAADAADGSFNSGEEPVTFTSWTLADGTHRFELRLVSSPGTMTQPPYPYQDLIIQAGAWKWQNFQPQDWVNTGQPDCSVEVRNKEKGLDVSSAEYCYSTDGGGTWSAWQPAECTGSDGSLVFETITARAAPFNQESATQNLVRFRISDLVGASTESPDYTVKIDLTAPSLPTISTTPPPEEGNVYHTDDITFSFQSTDEASGMAGYLVWLDAQPQQWVTGTSQVFQNIADGPHTFHGQGKDNAGNLSEVADYVFSVVVPPGSHVKPLAHYQTSAQVQLAWEPDAGTTDIATYTIEVYDEQATAPAWQDIAELTDVAVTSGTYTGQTDHAYRFRSRAKDQVGNVETDLPDQGDATTTVDATPPTKPTVTTTPPPDKGSAYHVNDMTFSWQSTDQGAGVAGYWVWLDSESKQWVTWTDKFYRDLADGAHTFHAQAKDSAGSGNVSEITDYNFTVDTVCPSSHLEPLPRYTTSLEVQLRWGPDEGVADIATYTIQVYDERATSPAWQDIANLTEVAETSGTYAGEDGHTYRFRSKASDNAGNVETAILDQGDTKTTVDAVPPRVLEADEEGPAGAYVRFSEAVDRTSAENAANYEVTPEVVVSGATVDTSDRALVHLTFERDTAVLTEYTVRVPNVTDVAGNLVDAAYNQATWERELAHPFSVGRSMVSVPVLLDNKDPAGWLQTQQIARWKPDEARYVSYPGGSWLDLEPGRGLWSKWDAWVTAAFAGEAVSAAQPFQVSVLQGWNQIGNPYYWSACPWAVFREANKGLVGEYGWAWTGTAYLLVYGDASFGAQTQLEPWQGYWIWAEKAGTITFPLPTVSTARQTAEAAASQRSLEEGGWHVRLAASAGEAVDSFNVFGVTGGGGGQGGLRIPSPPRPESSRFVDLNFVSATGEDQAAVDLRPSFAARAEWEFVVETDIADAEVTLTWPSLLAVPLELDLVLVDQETGARRYMRTTASYTFNTGPQGGGRRFKIEAGTALGGRLAIAGLSAVATKGGALAISYTVSKAALVDVTIYTLSGEAVGRPAARREAAPGANTIYWDSRGTSGALLPGGVYLCEVSAYSQDGQVTRAVYAVTVTR